MSNPNASDGSSPSILTNPPAFSPPRYVVWVNSFWLLALLVSLSGVLSATIEQRCALRHMAITQNKDHSPERRARIHAVFAKSEYGRFNFRDSSAMVFCLHLSLFLFMAGFLVYFYNVNHDTFYAVVWWVAIVTILYMLYTVVPIFIPEELLFTPFSGLAFRVYIFFLYPVSRILSCFSIGERMADHYDGLQGRYSKGFIEGKIESAEFEASRPSPSIDTEVFAKILLTLDEDHALGDFFDAIPGFCASNLVQNPLDDGVRTKLRGSLTGFLDRTFSSHLFAEEDRIHRLRTCLRAAHSALQPLEVSQVIRNFSGEHGDENLRRMLVDACVIAYTQDRDGKWTMLAADVLGVPERVFQNYQNGDSVLLATLIHVAREALRTGRSERGVLESLSRFDVHNTISELQHDFCILWNEVLQNATHRRDSSTPTQILAGIRRLFATLHQGDHPALTQFPAFRPIDDLDPILRQPSSYPSCDVPSHLASSHARVLATTSSLPPYGTLAPLKLDDPSFATITASSSASPHLVQTPGVITQTDVPTPVLKGG
jgi:Family of unknown function (DUF6535)